MPDEPSLIRCLAVPMRIRFVRPSCDSSTPTSLQSPRFHCYGCESAFCVLVGNLDWDILVTYALLTSMRGARKSARIISVRRAAADRVGSRNSIIELLVKKAKPRAGDLKMRASRRCNRALFLAACLGFLCGGFGNDIVVAGVINIVALGASNTSGWGIGSQNAYPAQLEAMLKARGYDAHVANAGVNFDTTSGMLRRLDSAVPPGTSIVILNPGGNDLRFFGSKEQRAANIAAIVDRLHARHIKVIVFENTIVPPTQYQWDGIHFTSEGHNLLASYLMRQLIATTKPRE
jgi:acyl-CoA thioesterase-1